MIFEYSVQRTFNEVIDVVDIGNTALKCVGSKLDEYTYEVRLQCINYVNTRTFRS